MYQSGAPLLKKDKVKDKALFYQQRILGCFYHHSDNFWEAYLQQCGKACVKNMSDSSILVYGLAHEKYGRIKGYFKFNFIWTGFMDYRQLRLWDGAYKLLK